MYTREREKTGKSFPSHRKERKRGGVPVVLGGKLEENRLFSGEKLGSTEKVYEEEVGDLLGGGGGVDNGFHKIRGHRHRGPGNKQEGIRNPKLFGGELWTNDIIEPRKGGAFNSSRGSAKGTNCCRKGGTLRQKKLGITEEPLIESQPGGR